MPKRILILVLALPLNLALWAQKGLHVAQLFDGRYHNRKDATEVLMKGRQLGVYKLGLFRSLTLGPQSSNVSVIEPLVKADGRSAIDKELTMRGGRLAVAFYQLPSVGKTRRYLYYSNAGAGSGPETAQINLIYMEGTATLDELKRSFKK